MAARLVPADVANNAAQHAIALGGEPVCLGRASENEVVLDDPEVSKRHAEVRWSPRGFVLRDLGSSNGTFVNGREVETHVLQNGDLVELGASCYRFELGSDADVRLSPQGAVDMTKVVAASSVASLLEGRTPGRSGQSDQTQAAFRAVQDLIAITDLRALCQHILEVTFRLVKADTGTVMLFDERRTLVPWAHRTTLPDGTDRRTLSRTLVDRVLKEKSAILASDAMADSRFSSSQSMILSGVRSLLCVPLLSADRIFGILHISNGAEVGVFGRNDLELMCGIGAGAGVAISNAYLAHQLAEEARTRESLGRFLSPQLVEQVVTQHLEIKRGGDERQVTVMFADIRGFTSLTERRRATEVVSLLNEYFDQMVEVVFKHGGTLDKFIGDALMAVWGSPVVHPDDAARAVRAAREMQETLRSLNELRVARGEDAIGVGVGLASGVCVAGAIGARRRIEFTVIGDAVNLASRLCGLAKAGEVICDEKTFELAGASSVAERLAPATVKGKEKPVQIYRLRSDGA